MTVLTLLSANCVCYNQNNNKKALLSQRWPRDAPYVYLQAIYPNFVHAYGHYTMCGFWFWTNL